MKAKNPTPPGHEARSTRRGIVVMVVSVLGFTLNTLLLRHLSGGGSPGPAIGPEMGLFFRALVGTAVIALFFGRRGATRVREVFTDRALVLRGVTGLLGTAAYYATVVPLGAGKATLLCNTYVIFASILAVFALGESLSRARLGWLVTAFAGIALLVGVKGGVPQVGRYELLALFGAAMAAWTVVLLRSLAHRFSISTIYLAQCLWILGPTAFLAGPKLGSLGGEQVALLVLAALAASGGQLAMNEGFRCLTVATGASLQMLWPVATTAGGWLLFGETFATLQAVGAVLILVAIWRVAARPPARRLREITPVEEATPV